MWDMYNCSFPFRSGSLGSAGVQLASNQSSPASEYAMGEAGIENLENAQKLVRDLRQKTRAQAQQLLAWRRAYKMQVNKRFCYLSIGNAYIFSLVKGRYYE